MSGAYGLVIVESPAKTKKIEKILARIYGVGKFKVAASMGHIRDLPRKELGVNIAANFEPHYVIPDKKRQVFTRLRQLLKGASALYLAADPDREGEAIAWHLLETLKPECPVRRVTFNAITHNAIKAGFEMPRQIDSYLVEAQETRRIVDRLVGYKVSPLLWDAIDAKGVSAGRVQSVALRLVVERHRAIEAFVPRDYYSIQAGFEAKNGVVTAKLYAWKGEKWTTDTFPTVDDALAVIEAIRSATFSLFSLEHKPVLKHPPAPFTTSTLQQAAAKHLGLAPDKTMQIAQKLYEQGFITYMRTDSPTVSPEAQIDAKQEIVRHFGKAYLPGNTPIYRSTGSAQEAHECIRPTHIEQSGLEVDDKDVMGQLYRLIWQRFIASQMSPARYEQTIVTITDGGDAVFRVSGKVLTLDGFLKLYVYEDEDEKDDSEQDDVQMPVLVEGETLTLNSIEAQQHFTKAPSAFTEASLVKALESNGVGRPSTFASMVATIRDKAYVEVKKKKLVPTAIGLQVMDFLLQHFPDIFNVSFTSDLETGLDLIALGNERSHTLMSTFWKDFEPLLIAASNINGSTKPVPEATDIQCPNCGAQLLIRTGKKGQFYSCSQYPKCGYSRSLDVPEPEIIGDCPDCDGKLTIKTSRKNTNFVACLNYPTCKYSRDLTETEKELI